MQGALEVRSGPYLTDDLHLERRPKLDLPKPSRHVIAATIFTNPGIPKK
jgi:hypothetical protein